MLEDKCKCPMCSSPAIVIHPKEAGFRSYNPDPDMVRLADVLKIVKVLYIQTPEEVVDDVIKRLRNLARVRK